MPLPVVILNESTVASYGTIGRLYAMTLTRMGISCVSAPYPLASPPRAPRGALVLHNTLGFRFTPIRGAINIAVPFHEWSRYPEAWSERLNRFDAVWAASRHIRDLLVRSGVTVPIAFAPPALDLERRPPARRPGPHRPFRFLFVGEPHFRKGHHLLVEGFRRLRAGGRRRATLTIKTSPDCVWTVPDRDVRVIAARWPRRRLLDLYRTHDAFVSASLGEGLGLGVAEAILSGVPVVTNRWGGHRSLLTTGGFHPIAYRETAQPFCSRPDFFAPGQRCALATPAQVAAAMADAMDATPTARNRQTARAETFVRRRFGFDAASRRLRALIDAYE